VLESPGWPEGIVVADTWLFAAAFTTFLSARDDLNMVPGGASCSPIHPCPKGTEGAKTLCNRLAATFQPSGPNLDANWDKLFAYANSAWYPVGTR
jgi:hypothetical protein